MSNNLAARQTIDPTKPDWCFVWPEIDKQLQKDLRASLQPGANTPQARYIELLACADMLTLGWVIRLVHDKTYRHPKALDKRLIGYYKPHGQFWAEVIYSCTMLHSFGVGAQHPNPERWFVAIWGEWHDGERQAPTKPIKKRQAGKKLDAAISRLGRVPPKMPELEGSPILEDFLQAGYQLARRSDMFKERFWKPFIAASREMLQQHEQIGVGSVYVTDSSLIIKLGRLTTPL
jgi:hypothetical protein